IRLTHNVDKDRGFANGNAGMVRKVLRTDNRGYSYVGVSRAKRRADVFLMCRIRRSDWRAGKGEGSDEQNEVSGLSESTHSSEPDELDETSSDEESPQPDSTSSSFMPTTSTGSQTSGGFPSSSS
ncbi:unnamed protein product, partial [Symbiodinium pilosum]